MTPCQRTQAAGTEGGFTITEVLIAAVLTGMAVVLLFAAWTFVVSFAGRGGTELEAERLGRIALDTIVRDLRETSTAPDAIAIWSTADGAPVDAIGIVSARQEVAGRPFNVDPHGKPTWNTEVYYVHDPAAAVLRRLSQSQGGALRLPPSTEGRVMTRGTRGVRFAREGAVVTITLKLAAGRREITLGTSVLPRN